MLRNSSLSYRVCLRFTFYYLLAQSPLPPFPEKLRTPTVEKLFSSTPLNEGHSLSLRTTFSGPIFICIPPVPRQFGVPVDLLLSEPL